MGKLIYLLNTSLDGFIETPDHSLDWATVDEEIHGWFNDQMRSLDATLYGRRLYEVMAAHWPTAEDDPSTTDVEREFARIWNPLPKVVFSSSLESVDHNSRLVRGDVGEVLEEVRREFDGDLGVAGPNLAGQFVRAWAGRRVSARRPSGRPRRGHPVSGRSSTRRCVLRLTETRTFASGVTQVSYAPA